MTFPSLAIANEFVDIGRANGATDLTPMKLQKLVYYAHGWHLAATGQPLINEQVEAWPYGPVVRSIYDAAKIYGNQPVYDYLHHPFFEPQLDPNQKQKLFPLLNWVWQQYGKFSGIQLSNMTHEVGSPWHNTYDKYSGNPPYGTDISKDEIQRYFAQKLSTLLPA